MKILKTYKQLFESNSDLDCTNIRNSIISHINKISQKNVLILHEELNILKTLIQNYINNNCNINKPFTYGYTILKSFIMFFITTYYEGEIKTKYDILKLLLENGAENIKDNFNSSPLSILITYKKYDIIIFMLNHNIKYNSKDIFLKLMSKNIYNEEKIKFLKIFDKYSNFNFLVKNKANTYFFNLLPKKVQNEFLFVKRLINMDKFNI